MTDIGNVNDLVKSVIQTQIISAFNSGPELIEKLVKSALSAPVGEFNGRVNTAGFGENKIPYLDWLVNDTIRQAALEAVTKIVRESSEDIEKAVRASLSSETVVSAFSKAIVNTVDSAWKINVSFAVNKNEL